MGKEDYYSKGDWNVYCDYCDKKRKASDCRLTWDNALVCSDTCWEPRHPQDFVRGKVDKQRTPPHLTRPDDQQGFTDTTLSEAASKGHKEVTLASASGVAKYSTISIKTDVVPQAASGTAGDNVDLDSKEEQTTFINEQPAREHTDWYTKVDNSVNEHFMTAIGHTVDFDIDKNYVSYLARDFGADYFSGDFSHTFEIFSKTPDQGNSRCFIWALSDQIGDLEAIDVAGGNFDAIWLDSDATHFAMVIRTIRSGAQTSTSETSDLPHNTPYYAGIVRVGTAYTLSIYSDKDMITLATDAVSVNASSALSSRYFYFISSWNQGVDNKNVRARISNHRVSNRTVGIEDAIVADCASGNVVSILHDERFLGTNEVSISDY